MIIANTRFGDLAVEDASSIEFSRPLLGLEDSRRYVLLDLAAFRPFLWLQSVDVPEVAVPLADPWSFFPDYEPDPDDEFLAALGISETDEVAVYCLLTPGPEGLAMNLTAPVLLNKRCRKGGQVVLDNPSYTTVHSLKREAAPCS